MVAPTPKRIPVEFGMADPEIYAELVSIIRELSEVPDGDDLYWPTVEPALVRRARVACGRAKADK